MADDQFTDDELLAVLRIVDFYSPNCSDYQLWRDTAPLIAGRAGGPLPLYLILDRLLADCLISREKREGYPHWCYSITGTGKNSLQKSQN